MYQSEQEAITENVIPKSKSFELPEKTAALETAEVRKH